MNRKFCLLVALMCICFSGFGQDVVAIEGKITDKKSNPISFATVYLLNTNLSVFSDGSGYFKIKNIPAGDYNVAISAIGYATINDKLHVIKIGRAHV